MSVEELVADYLRSLDSEARRLPDGRRRELVDEVREHIEVALGGMSRPDEAAVRTVLERLGSPVNIVAAEAGSPEDAAGRTPRGGLTLHWWGPMEVAAMLLVSVGMIVLPLFGPLLGIVLFWMSGRLTRRRKIGISIVVLALAVLPMLTLLAVGGSTVRQGPAPIATASPTVTSEATETPVTP